MSITSLQPLLFDDLTWNIVEPEPPLDGHRLTPAEKAAAFHAANPQVLEMFRRLAVGARLEGRQRWSINAIFEIVRHHYWLHTRDEEGFKLNNSHRAWYARRLMAEEPALQGFFETRGDKEPES